MACSYQSSALLWLLLAFGQSEAMRQESKASAPSEAFAKRVFGLEDGSGGTMPAALFETVHTGLHVQGVLAVDRSHYLKFVLPIIALTGFFYLLLHALKDASVQCEQADEKESRDTSDHPLFVKAAMTSSCMQADILHPEITLAENFKQTFTQRRLIAMIVAIVLCVLVTEFTDEWSFAIKQEILRVHDKDICKEKCRQVTGALCDSDHLDFTFKWCNKKGHCIKEPKEEDSSYLKTPDCTFKVVPPGWQVHFVLVFLIIGILLIVEGLPAEMILIGVSCIFAASGIISAKEAFAGLGSSGVVGLAMLFPIAAAVEETGVLDSAVGLMLGNPSNFFVALFHMMILVAVLSAFLSNTAIVTMLILVIGAWSRRMSVSPGKLLMPLSFAAQFGGSMTLIGSSSVLIAKAAVDQNEYDMKFFDLFPAGAALALLTMIMMAICLPLLSSSAAVDNASSVPSSIGQSIDSNGNKSYEVTFIVKAGCTFVGESSNDVCLQLGLLPGVEEVQHITEGSTIKEGTTLRCQVQSSGVVSLRLVNGLAIENEKDLRRLGMERKHRHLYEVVLQPTSTLVSSGLNVTAMLQVLGSCPVAFRGKKSLREMPLDGDILLVEADERYVNTQPWTQEFSITSKVPNSSPQRVGGVGDVIRCVLVCLGMLIFIGLVTVEKVNLAEGGGICVLLLVLSGAYKMNDIYASIKGPVLLTIAGAAGLSTALQVTGLAVFASTSLTTLALPLGTHGVRASVYFISMFLSMFMNNSATVAIVGPMLSGMARETGQDLKSLVFVMVFAACACLTTPLGYQTNLMVMKDGGYTFGDFVKYGGPVQLFHLFATLSVVVVFNDYLQI